MGKIEGIGATATEIGYIICFQVARTPQGSIAVEPRKTESRRYTAIIGLRMF